MEKEEVKESQYSDTYIHEEDDYLYNELNRVSNELEEEFYNTRIEEEETDEKYPFDTWLTGLEKGKIHEVEVLDNGNILLTVERRKSRRKRKWLSRFIKFHVEGDGMVEIEVENTGEWHHSNELSRLLRSCGIFETNLNELYGQEITIKADYFIPVRSSRTPSEDTEWSVYTKSRFDTLGSIKYYGDLIRRCFGHQKKFDRMFDAFSFHYMFFKFWAIILLGGTFFFALDSAMSYGFFHTGVILTITTLWLTMYSMLAVRLAMIPVKKVRRFLKKNTIHK